MRWKSPGILVVCLLVSLSCAPNRAGEGESDRLQAPGDTWGPLLELKDDSNIFPNEKPPGGWWVTPIHANLLASGKVLITGWSRRDHDTCTHHGTRRNGTTFVIDPNQLSGGTLNVAPL